MADSSETEMTTPPDDQEAPSPADAPVDDAQQREADDEPIELARPVTDDSPVPADTSLAPADPDPDPAPAPAEPASVDTGHPQVDAAVGRLAELDGLPVERHGEVLDDVHARLRDVLAAATEPPGSPAD